MATTPAQPDGGIRDAPAPGASPAEPDQTMAMGVANIGFMLERLGADCDDLQYLRELTKNALEADATLIVWDVDWLLYEASGVFKLCCIDNGRGMIAPRDGAAHQQPLVLRRRAGDGRQLRRRREDLAPRRATPPASSTSPGGTARAR